MTYRQKDQDRRDSCLVDNHVLSLVQTLRPVTFGADQTENPSLGYALVVMYCLDRVVLEHEDDREEDDVGNNDENNSDTSPLKRNDTSHSAVRLAGAHRLDAIAVRGQARPFCRRTVIGQGSKIDLDTISESGELDDDRETGEYKQRYPEVGKTVLVVDVTGSAKSEGHATEDEGNDDANKRNTPARSLGKNHEVATHDNLPTNLEMQGQRSQEDPHDTGPASEQEKGPRGTADFARFHAVRCNVVVALLWLIGKWHDEAKLKGKSVSLVPIRRAGEGQATYVHNEHGYCQANAEVMSIGFINRQNSP